MLPARINTKRKKNTLVLMLQGRFDFHSHRTFLDAYKENLSDETINTFEVDLNRVEYMDSSALSMLLLLREKASLFDKKVVLLNCQGTVQQIIEVSNFSQLFEIK